MTRPLRVLVIHPGASWSTHDVYDGLVYGLRANGVEVFTYRLDLQLDASQKSLYWIWRGRRKSDPTLPKPNGADVLHHAAVCALDAALDRQVDVMLVISAMFLHPNHLVKWRRAGQRVAVLFTETPYDLDHEQRIAALVDGVWTNERTAIADFAAVNPRTGYLAHAWHPDTHRAEATADDAAVAAHDVVFVGSGFRERAKWFNAIDWTGIDLGLYGQWKSAGLRREVRACVRGAVVPNAVAAALYRRAKIGLNLYRTTAGFGLKGPAITHAAESLNPRAYELAACGAFHLSDRRAEVGEIFGDAVPTFGTPAEASALIRHWLADDAGRARLAATLPATVAEASWIQRSRTVIADLQRLIFEGDRTAAAGGFEHGSVRGSKGHGVSVGERVDGARVGGAVERLDAEPHDQQDRRNVVWRSQHDVRTGVAGS
jgi:spore maturation protein CgeB